MTDFAQRLVARSAGRQAGLPLLMPRPASRFERNESQALEEVTETTAPAAAMPVADPVPGRIYVAEAQRPLGRRAEPPEPETMDVAEGMPARGPQQKRGPVVGRAGAVDRPLPKAAFRSAERVGINEPYREQADSPVTRHTSVTRIVAASPEPRDEAEAARLSPIIARPDVAKAAPALAPAISIGRIEVQFMAPEKPSVAPRPELQRTRGFDAYARARRGMPR